MLLAIDMGNTQIEIGVLDKDRLVFSERISTDKQKTETEYAILFNYIFNLRHIDASMIDGAIISSVVPPLTFIIKEAVRMTTGKNALVIGAGIKTGLNILIDNPKALGADIVVDSVACASLYGAPAIVIDMGTATTITCLDRDKNYRGGAIIPGLMVAMNAMISNTAQLPHIDLENPGSVIGTNTVKALKSGAIYAQASMIDGMVERMKEELKEPDAIVVATGGLADRVVPSCRTKITIDKELMMKGLRLIYDRNQK